MTFFVGIVVYSASAKEVFLWTQDKNVQLHKDNVKYAQKGEIMSLTQAIIDSIELGKQYDLREIYDLMEDYCVGAGIDDWKHKIRRLLQEWNGVRRLGEYPVTYYGNAKYSVG